LLIGGTNFMQNSGFKYCTIFIVLLTVFYSQTLFSQQHKPTTNTLHGKFHAADTVEIAPDNLPVFIPELIQRRFKHTTTTSFLGINSKPVDSITTIKTVKTQIPLRFDTIYYQTNWRADTALKKTIRYPALKNAALPRYKDQAVCDVQYLDVEQGLSSSYILSLLTDSRGLLWFGSYEGGLIRYNGHTFTEFRKQNGLPGNSIRALYEDSKGHIWMGTQGNGLAIFDGHQVTFLPNKANLHELYVYEITADQQGRMWVSTRNNGLFVITEDAILQLTEKNGLPDNEVFTTFAKNSDSIWIGTAKGPSVINAQKITNYYFKNKNTTNQVKDFSTDKFGNLLLGTHRNPVVFNKNTFRELHIRLKIKKIEQDASHNLWIGSAGYGVFKLESDDKNYETARYIRYTEKLGLSHNYISDITIKNGLLWMGTYGGGVNRLKIDGFTHITTEQGLKSENIWAFAEDENHNLWLGTETAGICHMGDSTFKYYDRDSAKMKSHIVLSAMKDHKNNLWFGTYKGGVYKINQNRLFEVNLNPDKRRLKIISMLADSKGNLWFGTWDDGVFMHNGDSVTQFNKSNGLSNNDVFDIMEDQNGDIWFATDGGGLNRYNGQQFFHYNTSSGLTSNAIYSTVQMQDGSIWVGTHDAGIMVINDTNSFTLTIKDGLSSNNIKSIIADNQNRIWVGTENGLNLIEYSGNPDLPKSKSIKIQYFKKKDGLKGLDFHTNSAYIDQNNTAWWGTGKSLTYLNLSRLSSDTTAPGVMIDALQIKQRWIDFHNTKASTEHNPLKISTKGAVPFYNKPKNLQVPYNARHITFYFGSTKYQNIEDIKYITRLYPLEQKWSLPNSESKVDYRNIPPGTYTFQVKAITPFGLKSKTANQKITISAPWWMTVWAYLAYGIILLSIILLFFRWRTRVLKKRQKELEIQVKERTIEIQEKNEELNALVAQVTEQRNEIATQRDMVVQQRDQLEQINKSTSQSIDYAQRIQSSLMPEMSNFGVHFPESFLLFRPRDIVSGDFYWWAEVGNKTVVVAADCTGHGVPGAFMSILGMSFLREIVLKEQTTRPDEILNLLRTEVIQAMQQKNTPGEQRDGLDMTILTFEKGSNKALFAGAHNAIYHIKNQQLNEYQGDRFTIALYPKLKPFTVQEIEFKPGDKFYMFTDGFHDQFGGKTGKKIKKSRFQELILKIHEQSMQKQKHELIQFLENWQGEEEQIDDILVMGFQIPGKGI